MSMYDNRMKDSVARVLVANEGGFIYIERTQEGIWLEVSDRYAFSEHGKCSYIFRIPPGKCLSMTS